MDEETERWRELCKLAANERDGKKLLELVEEINRILDAKERSSQYPQAA